MKSYSLLFFSAFVLSAHAHSKEYDPNLKGSSTTLNESGYTDFGPLQVLTQAPIQALGLSLKTRDAFGWEKGTLEAYGQGTISSVWADSADYMMDYYQNDVNVGVIYAPKDNWKIDFNYLYRFAANNKLDSVVSGFHSTFGLSDNGRSNVPDDRFYMKNKKNGQVIEDFKGDTINNAFNLYVDHTLFQTKRQALSLGGSLYYNKVFSGTFENSTFEQAVQLNYSFYLTDSNRFYTSVNFIHHDTDTVADFNLREFTTNASLSYQYIINERHSIIGEFRMQQGALHDSGNELSKITYEPVMGYRYNLGFAAIEFSMTENVIYSDNAADFTMTLGYRQRI